ncbi:MAG: hypothetical protein AABX12_00485 [Nanoarchaeota archaeon]
MRPLERVPLGDRDLAELETQDWMMDIAFKTHRAFINSMYGDFGLPDKPSLVDLVNVRPLLCEGAICRGEAGSAIDSVINISDYSFDDLPQQRLLRAEVTAIHESAHYLHMCVNPDIYQGTQERRPKPIDSFLEFLADYSGLVFSERFNKLNRYIHKVILCDSPYVTQFAAHRLFSTTKPSIASLVQLNADKAHTFYEEHISFNLIMRNISTSIIVRDSASEDVLFVPWEEHYDSTVFLQGAVA